MGRTINERTRTLLVVGTIASILCVSVTWSGAGAAQSAEIVALVNAQNSVTALSEAELRNIYLGRTSFWGAGDAIHPYVRPANTPAGRGLFRVLGMAPARFRHHWNSRQLSGRGTAPRELPSAAHAIAYVAADPGGLTVLTTEEASRLPRGVKVVPIR